MFLTFKNVMSVILHHKIQCYSCKSYSGMIIRVNMQIQEILLINLKITFNSLSSNECLKILHMILPASNRIQNSFQPTKQLHKNTLYK